VGFLEDDNSTVYLYIKAGKLRNNQGLEKTGFTGYLEKIEKRTSKWNDEEIPGIRITMKDPDSDLRVAISFNEHSWFTFAFFNRLVQIQYDKPFTFGVLGDKDPEKKKVSYCFMRQGKELIKAVSVVPEPDKVTVNGKPVTDWAKPVAKYTEAIAAVTKKLEEIGPHPEPDIKQPLPNLNPAAAEEPPVEANSTLLPEVAGALNAEPIIDDNSQIIDDDLPF
jgi:hypothetical protein